DWSSDVCSSDLSLSTSAPAEWVGRGTTESQKGRESMRGTRLWMGLALLVALMALVVTGCGDDDDGGDDGATTTEETAAGGADFETAEEGVLTVGTDAPYPPFEIG